MAKIEKKLMYWVTVRLNSAGREVIANSVLVSSLLYSLAIWGGMAEGIKRITGKIRNFYWAGTTQQARARVAWQTCCLKHCDGGLNLIDPQEASIALMAKWVVVACEPGASNFKALLWYRLSLFQPHSRGKWNPRLQSVVHAATSSSLTWLACLARCRYGLENYVPGTKGDFT
jgi:hypothetical protein